MDSVALGFGFIGVFNRGAESADDIHLGDAKCEERNKIIEHVVRLSPTMVPCGDSIPNSLKRKSERP